MSLATSPQQTSTEAAAPTREAAPDAGLMGRAGYAGLFLIALVTLMHEILLTRIFSVTMWYHFAFVAVSVAMFGMSVGAIIVYLAPGFFSAERTRRQLALSTLVFALSIVISFFIHLKTPFIPSDLSLGGLASKGLFYAVISIPFIFSGVAICLSLTRFPAQVSRLYAADLIGAACGCVLTLYLLSLVGDAPSVVVGLAGLGAIAAWLFAREAGAPAISKISIVAAVVLFLGAMTMAATYRAGRPLVKLTWVKGEREEPALYERWNAFARIRVIGNPDIEIPPYGWGLSPRAPKDPARQMTVFIDASAGTLVPGFDGDFEEHAYLKYDISNLVHYVRRNADVGIIGIGGGRDALSALAFDQASVTGVEINKDILKAVNERYGDYSGHIDDLPNVEYVNDEARSYFTRSERKFDIIQASLIDTWAASAAGAFVLTESSLYTVEAWRMFLDRLKPGGILNFSRYYEPALPGEMYRMMSLAVEALRQSGIGKPADHIFIARVPINEIVGTGSMLVSRDPFTEEDLATLERVCAEMEFDVVFSPRVSVDPAFASIAAAEDPGKALAHLPIDISPSTDNRPFFFQMLRFRDLLNPDQWLRDESGNTRVNLLAVSVLASLLGIVLTFTVLCMFVPLIAFGRRSGLRRATPLLIYFAAIGFGFMLVEISQMQRLVIFLGHPAYSLTVVLFTMLLSSGIGSRFTANVTPENLNRSALIRTATLLVVLFIFGLLTPSLLQTFRGESNTVRIAIAVAILFPLGFFMGMMFPLGMRLAASRESSLTPWLWAINGATSVAGSVLVIALSMAWGISFSFWVGAACYAAALFAAVWWGRRIKSLAAV